MEEILKLDSETGFVVRSSYQGSSGLLAMEGIRSFGTVTIREAVLKGTGTVFLTGVRVFDQNDVLLLDLSFDRFTTYSREKVRKAVLSELVQLLTESATRQGQSIDVMLAWEKINNELNMAFYANSYQAILPLAKEWGIELYKSE